MKFDPAKDILFANAAQSWAEHELQYALRGIWLDQYPVMVWLSTHNFNARQN